MKPSDRARAFCPSILNQSQTSGNHNPADSAWPGRSGCVLLACGHPECAPPLQWPLSFPSPYRPLSRCGNVQPCHTLNPDRPQLPCPTGLRPGASGAWGRSLRPAQRGRGVVWDKGARNEHPLPGPTKGGPPDRRHRAALCGGESPPPSRLRQDSLRATCTLRSCRSSWAGCCCQWPDGFPLPPSPMNPYHKPS